MAKTTTPVELVDCPECEICCALLICCSPNSEQQLVAMTNLLVKDGKWTDPVLARAIAEATVKTYFASVTKRQHGALLRTVQALVKAHEAPPA